MSRTSLMLMIPLSSSWEETFSFSALLRYWSRFAVAYTPESGPVSSPHSRNRSVMTSENWIANGSIADS